MEAWGSIWGWVLIAVLVVFAILAIVITIGGFYDVRALFSSMGQRDSEASDTNDQLDRKVRQPVMPSRRWEEGRVIFM